MSAKIIEIAAWREAHPEHAVRVRVVYDPLWMVRFWLACWGVK